MKNTKPFDMENLTDEEIDRFYRERNSTNSNKSMLPLYVYLILKDHSDRYHHLTQKEIMRYLAEYPYFLTIERKALGRTICSMMLSDVGVYTHPKSGTWMEQEKRAA